jgi:arylsulfatase A-like enzyme
VHAHTFYPSYLIRNSEEVPLPGNTGNSFYEGETHAQLEIFKESISFIKKHKDEPFFCYLPWTPPHGLWGIDENDPSWQLFKDKPWTAGQRTNQDAKIYAAFMHMMDRQLGEIIKLLKKLKLDENTIFFLSGDNGGQTYFATKDRPHGFFAPNLNPETGKRFRAGKGYLYEGGLKIPYLVRWPGKIKPGSVSDHLFYHPDVMPTIAELTNTECPKTDGISFLPTLLSSGKQEKHTYMYWELGPQRAVRKGDWKAYRDKKRNWELYDLSTDIEEQINLAHKKEKVLKDLIALAESSHQPARLGKILNQALVEKDNREAPHERNLQFKKSKQ